MMLMMSHKTLLAVCLVACSTLSSVGARSAPASRVAALGQDTDEAGPKERGPTTSDDVFFGQRAASARGVPDSSRKLFGAYEAPDESIPDCNGTFVDFEGVDVVILEQEAVYNISDGSGVLVSFDGPNGTVSFVSSASEAGGVDVSPTAFTSGGVFATESASSGDIVAGFVIPDLACAVSFGFAVASSVPVDAAVEVFVPQGPFDAIRVNASATLGDFDRASGFVSVQVDQFAQIGVVPLVSEGGVRTLILDNVCVTPCTPE